MSYVSNAFFWGILSAVSLPLGALLGLWLKPRIRISSAFMAFGAGALLFALTIELFGHLPHEIEIHGTKVLITAVLAALSGGLLFDLLNQMLNNRGAFLRKFSVARTYVAKAKLHRHQQLVDELSRIRILQDIDPVEMAKLVERCRRINFNGDEVIFRQGDEADSMYFIVSGAIRVVVHDQADGEKVLAQLEPGDTFGELGVLSDHPRSADAVAVGETRVYRLAKRYVDEIVSAAPSIQKALTELAVSRINDYEVKSGGLRDGQWRKQTFDHLAELDISVSQEEIVEEGKATAGHSGAALAIWLGIAIDGVPESLVIGMLAVSAKGMSLAFIAGVFLANLPEAMSSAVSMRANGMGLKKIYLMWGSICLMTGVGAAIGASIFSPANAHDLILVVTAIEGIAAGAMLTMIAETMLPEAFEQGGSIVGFSTLCGFLAAFIVKMI